MVYPFVVYDFKEYESFKLVVIDTIFAVSRDFFFVAIDNFLNYLFNEIIVIPLFKHFVGYVSDISRQSPVFQSLVEFIFIPRGRSLVFIYVLSDDFRNEIGNEVQNVLMNVLAFKHFHSFAVHNRSLNVHYVVVLNDVFSDTEISAFDRSLRVFYRTGKHFRLKRRVLFDFESIVNTFKSFAAETLCKIVLKRNEEKRATGITLTSASTAELVIDTSRFVSLRTENEKSAERDDFFFFLVRFFLEVFVKFVVFFSYRLNFVRNVLNVRGGKLDHVVRDTFFYKSLLCKKFGVAAEKNIRTTTRHIRCDRNSAFLARLSDDLRFLFMVFSVKNVVFDFVFQKPSRNLFRFFYRYRTDEDGLPFFVALHNGVDDSFYLALFRGINNVGHIDSLNGFVGGNFENVESVNGSELFFLGFSRTGHTRKFVIKTEVVLESNRCVSFVFVSDRNVFFRFDCLVKTFRISSADHKTTRELVDDNDFAVRNEVVGISLENKMSFQSLLDMVIEVAVFDIRKVFDTEETFRFPRALLGYLNGFILEVDDVIFVGFKGFHKTIALDIQIGRLFAFTRNDKRRSRFVDQNRVYFVDDGEVKLSLNHIGKPYFKVVS